ncbi:akirin-2 isoform X2 [Sarcophilus harrisii]|uniref:akirin-2 isoform X2 n=1 Tax=Sarcophilus harrisii TaxID=9305 RepID=UPI001301EABA|nr:akirin-2 isoform X2 [Sarcophilus harrisii]
MRPTLGACRVRSLISGLGIVWRTAQALRELPFHLEAGGGRVRGRTALAGVGGGISRSSRSHVQSPMLSEQILYNIKQEYKRMQKRRHLETSFQQTDACCSSDSQPHAFLLNGPASPGTSSAASSPLKKEQPLFTLRQVGMICERLLKEREEKVREEYEEILTTKLAEQYDAFVKFTHDQIMRRYGEQPASYVS